MPTLLKRWICFTWNYTAPFLTPSNLCQQRSTMGPLFMDRQFKAWKKDENNCLSCPSPSQYIAYLCVVIGPFNVSGECRYKTQLCYAFSNKKTEQNVGDGRKSDVGVIYITMNYILHQPSWTCHLHLYSSSLELHMFSFHWGDTWQLALVKCKWIESHIIFFMIMHIDDGESHLFGISMDNHILI